ncbi:MAG: plastocyanin/azurin family copper-binding protein [Kofleriaceae bacterium]
MRTTTTWLTLIVLAVAIAPEVQADSRKKPAAATKADVDRLESRIEEQQKQIDKLMKAQQKYLEALKAAFGDSPVSANDPKVDEPKVEPKVATPAPEPKATPKAADKAAVGFTDTRRDKVMKLEPKAKKPEGTGTIVGKVTGVGDAVIYVDDIVETTRGSATMKQQGKQFVPNVLIVQKGTTVQFPNMDAFFHNVFSVTPDHSFDLGSYRQGETKSVTMAKPGVLSVYCNMHPQMVGHILVTPNGNYVRAGKDGFFRLTNVPAGKHRVVAWAPNAKPVVTEAEVSDAGVVTIELELKKGRSTPHTKKDGLPYGSYAE